MPIDLTSLDISLLGWLLIGAGAVVLLAAVVRLFGHLLHILIRGCGVVLVALMAFYALRLLGVF